MSILQLQSPALPRESLWKLKKGTTNGQCMVHHVPHTPIWTMYNSKFICIFVLNRAYKDMMHSTQHSYFSLFIAQNTMSLSEIKLFQ